MSILQTNEPNVPKAGRKKQVSNAFGSALEQPVYDAEAIEAILGCNTFRKDFALWWFACKRMMGIFAFFLKILIMAWWDRQIWSYIGEDDIDWAQSLRRRRHGRAITEKLLELGPTFIKVGQSMSTRVDLFRKEYIEELSQLQDRVPEFPLAQASAIVEAELGQAPEALFETFETQPLAAASLGQVHRVTLKDGRQAVIKIQRPNLTQLFRVDLCILKRVARLLQRSLDIGRGREWVYIVDEFGRTLFEEIDYIREGRNADRFRKSFADQPDIIIPQIYWRYTSRRVITMQYLPGIKVSDLDGLEQAGFSKKDISVRLVRAYFQQLLVDGFFHADPHPGNIVIDTQGNITLYDFGMVGSIRDDTRIKMVNTFLNIVGKRTDAILRNLAELNMVTPGADLEEIRAVVDWALDNYYDIPHDQLNFEQLADEMAEVMYYYPFKLPASFTFMFRALITLEGVATNLYPQIQFMGIAVDYAQDFLQNTYRLDKLLGGRQEGYTTLLKEGLALLGISAGRDRPTGHNPRVRLYHEEWKPLARYVKAGFLLLAGGQTAILLLIVSVIMGNVGHVSQQALFWTFFGFSVFLMCYLIITFGTLLWMPARKKPILFVPTKRPASPGTAPEQSFH